MSPRPLQSEPQSQSFAARCPLPVERAVAVVQAIAEQVANLHAAGQLHGNVTAETIEVNLQGQVRLIAGRETCDLGGGDAAVCPPELQDRQLAMLPVNIAAAREALAASSIDIDPRRIDVYQLGGLLCRLLTGMPVSLYLRSVKARRLIPGPLASVLDRALGYDPANRWHACEELIAGLNEAARATPDESATRLTAPQSPANQAAMPFQKLGAYRMIRRIGAGGMGEVYQAHDDGLDRSVAIKVLPPELAGNADFVRRFRSEATAAARLVHPNVVQIHAWGEEAGRHFFVMQLVSGESLAELLARRGRLTVEEALEIVKQVLAGLSAAHERGLVHRDVKPGNVLLDRESQRALVADFGLVKALDGESAHTVSGVIMGTVDYISPEQARGQPVDRRSDLYSLGVMLYQMLAGRLPFEADSPTGMIFQHAYEEPRPLCTVAPDVPQRLGKIVSRLMAKDPSRRHQNAEELLADIAAFRAGKAIVSAARQGGAAPRTSVIVAPRHEPAPALPLAFHGSSAWAGWRDWLFELTRGRSPEMLQGWQSTEQQVDGAVAEYERRRDSLLALVQEAEQVAAEFSAQIKANRESAAAAARRAAISQDSVIAERARREQADCEVSAAELATHFASQREQLAEMRSRLAEINATLERLRGQRSALQARLAAAKASLAMHGGARPASGRRWWLAIAAVCIALLIGLPLACRTLFRGDPPHEADPVVIQPAPPIVPQGDRPPSPIFPFTAGEALTSQLVWGEYFGLQGRETTNSLGMSLVVVPPGEFVMGAPRTEPGWTPADGLQHGVRLTRAMLVSTREATQSEFEQVMGFNPSYYAPKGAGGAYVRQFDTGQFPVECVTWYDACEFCNALSRREGLRPFYVIADSEKRGKNVVRATVTRQAGLGYRLPTEAEYEYFCRAGTTTPFWFGSVHDGTQGNVYGTRPYGTTQPGVFLNRTTTVGSYPPNPFGVYDVDGNVGEWCWDYAETGNLQRSPDTTAVDPSGPSTGVKRIARSSSSQYEPIYGRSGRRHGERPDTVIGWFGIRVVRYLE